MIALTSALAWLRAGQPPHWAYLLAGAWLGVSFALSKMPRVRANTTVELVLNFVNPRVRPIVISIPALGPLLMALLDTFDTPAPVSGIQQPDAPRARSASGKADVSLIVALGCAGLLIVYALCQVSGCALVKKAGINLAACAIGQVPGAVEGIIPDAQKALQGDSPTWATDLEGLGIKAGEDAVVCAIKALLARRGMHSPAVSVADLRGQAWLAAHGVK